MPTTIVLLGTLVPLLAACLFYVSDRRTARQGERASPSSMDTAPEVSAIDSPSIDTPNADTPDTGALGSEHGDIASSKAS